MSREHGPGKLEGLQCCDSSSLPVAGSFQGGRSDSRSLVPQWWWWWGGCQEPEHLLPSAPQTLAHERLLERRGLWSNSSGDCGIPHGSQPSQRLSTDYRPWKACPRGSEPERQRLEHMSSLAYSSPAFPRPPARGTPFPWNPLYRSLSGPLWGF